MTTKYRRFGTTIAILVAATTLTACAPATVPATPTTSATPVAAPTATATSTAAADPLTCDSITTAAKLTDSLGTAMTELPQAINDVSLAPLVYNGITCEWSGSKGASVDLVILGTNDAIAASKDETNCFGAATVTAGESGDCRFTKTSGQYWLSGSVSTAHKGINEAAVKTIKATITGFIAAAATAQPPVAPTTAPGVWPATSCAKLGVGGKVSAALGKPFTAQDEDNSGAAAPDGYYAVLAKAGLTSCDWTAKTGGASFNSIEFPGAGSLVTTIKAAQGVTPVALAGGASGYTVPVEGETTPELWYFDQPNLVIITSNSGVTKNQMQRAAGALATEFTS